jgi:phage terminase large subunit-like protein
MTIERARRLPAAFPAGAHDDQVDAATAAFRALLRRPRVCYTAA